MLVSRQSLHSANMQRQQYLQENARYRYRSSKSSSYEPEVDQPSNGVEIDDAEMDRASSSSSLSQSSFDSLAETPQHQQQPYAGWAQATAEAPQTMDATSPMMKRARIRDHLTRSKLDAIVYPHTYQPQPDDAEQQRLKLRLTPRTLYKEAKSFILDVRNAVQEHTPRELYDSPEKSKANFEKSNSSYLINANFDHESTTDSLWVADDNESDVASHSRRQQQQIAAGGGAAKDASVAESKRRSSSALSTSFSGLLMSPRKEIQQKIRELNQPPDDKEINIVYDINVDGKMRPLLSRCVFDGQPIRFKTESMWCQCGVPGRVQSPERRNGLIDANKDRATDHRSSSGSPLLTCRFCHRVLDPLRLHVHDWQRSAVPQFMAPAAIIYFSSPDGHPNTG